MKYNIHGENFEVTDALKNHIMEKVDKLERYFDTPPLSDVHVNLSVHNEDQKIEVTIHMPNLVLRAEEVNLDLYAATDLVVDKLERQIRKYKTRVNRKLRQQGAPKHVFAELEREAQEAREEAENAPEFEVVRTKRFDLKPMDAEEAIMQMEMLDHTFFVFSDAETAETNVVYRRKDGRYGLIEPTI